MPSDVNATTARVLLVDDHPIVRDGIRHLIEREPDLTVCGEAENAFEALDLIEADPPDVAVVDLSLKGSNGMDLIRDIKRRWPAVKILVLSMEDERYYARRVLSLGALGYLMKQEASKKVVAAIRRVLEGTPFVSQEVMRDIMLNPKITNEVDTLTDREIQVFDALGSGRNPRQIAEELILSPKTVESHIDRIKTKMGVQSGRELLIRAIEWKIKSRGGLANDA